MKAHTLQLILLWAVLLLSLEARKLNKQPPLKSILSLEGYQEGTFLGASLLDPSPRRTPKPISLPLHRTSSEPTPAHIHLLDSLHRTLPGYHSPLTTAPLAAHLGASLGTDLGTKLKTTLAGPLQSFIQLDMDPSKAPLYSKPLKDHFNTQYTLSLGVSNPNPASHFSFILDTGSGTTLLNDKRCHTSGCKKRKAFDSAKSPHYSAFGKLVRIRYAKGAVTIELGKDNVFMGDLKVTNQELGVVLKEKGLFTSASYDGIIGFAYPSLSENTKPFFDRIIEMKALPRNVFALYMSRRAPSYSSRLFLGGWPSSVLAGPLHYHPVVKKSWWTLSLDKVLVGGKNTGLCTKKTKCKIIMDTGSSLMATPPWALAPLLSKLNKYSTCKDILSYPEITFIIGGKRYSLNAYEYVLTSTQKIGYKKRPNKGKKIDVGGCTFGFSMFDVGKENVWIAGDIFLTKYFTVYDRDKDRVGIGLAKKNLRHGK